MSATEAHRHGGALDAAIARYGGRREDWLDLSTGINPVPPPLPELAPELWTRLPDAGLEDEALSAARRFYGVTQADAIVAAPGTQALISTLPHLFAPTRVAVVSPTYAEHAGGFCAAGHDVRRMATLDDLDAGTRILVVVNPNNPDGRSYKRTALLRLRDEMAVRDGLLIVDEAFIDPDPGESLAGEAGRPGLLVYRSFGKFFGLAGLRLGFALTEPDLAARLASRFGPWAVSGPALAIAKAMLDESVAATVRQSLDRQSGALAAVLERAGLERVGGTTLFQLVRHARAGALFEALCRRHILTRPFTDQPDWLRLGNPADAAAAERLSAALQDSLTELSRGR
ncbi:threonine-phosphate decarboxylase CobD [Mangrovicella endophytica]|uniref:threonine-phosphate decarboxylase CobD n=1 Tax=Mangrovicella endophytica TaxID=2066697 RepID=UPI000C9DFA42|nr:threonine-phosphate decarboxylase CobD [Mangrovicella endophytica]